MHSMVCWLLLMHHFASTEQYTLGCPMPSSLSFKTLLTSADVLYVSAHLLIDLLADVTCRYGTDAHWVETLGLLAYLWVTQMA